MCTIKNRSGLVGLMISSCLIGASSNALAAETYKIDPTHSGLFFRIKHVNVSYFLGRFNTVSGKFVLDADHPANSLIEVTIKTDSIDTNSADRDKHMKGPQFFNVQKFPEMTFKSTKITKSGDRTYKVEGEFTLLGKTLPLTVQIEHVGEGRTFMGQRSGFFTTFTIKRSEFGMNAMLNGLGDEIHLTLGIEGVKK